MSRVLSRLTRTASFRTVSSSGFDEYGDPVLVESERSCLCHWRPLSSSELPSGISEERWKLYVAPGETLSVEDRVAIDGEVYEIVTVPTERFNPRSGLVEAIEAELERRS